MKYNLNIVPTIKGENNEDIPYGINYSLSIFLAEILENNISVDNPYLEYRISQELKTNNEVELDDTELVYLKSLVERLQINNLLKGQILDLLVDV